MKQFLSTAVTYVLLCNLNVINHINEDIYVSTFTYILQMEHILSCKIQLWLFEKFELLLSKSLESLQNKAKNQKYWTRLL